MRRRKTTKTSVTNTQTFVREQTFRDMLQSGEYHIATLEDICSRPHYVCGKQALVAVTRLPKVTAKNARAKDDAIVRAAVSPKVLRVRRRFVLTVNGPAEIAGTGIQTAARKLGLSTKRRQQALDRIRSEQLVAGAALHNPLYASRRYNVNVDQLHKRFCLCRVCKGGDEE
jgi:hypothetical protein